MLTHEQLRVYKKRARAYRKVPLLKLWWKADRWPWQYRIGIANHPDDMGKPYGWKIRTGGLGRFGGGWEWSLGIEVGGSTTILNLVYGTIRITTDDPVAAERKRVLERVKRDQERNEKQRLAQKGALDTYVAPQRKKGPIDHKGRTPSDYNYGDCGF